MSSPYNNVELPNKTERKIAAHKRECTTLAFNPLGDVIATGGGDNLIKLWNVNTGKEISELKGFTKAVTDVAMSLDNELIVGASLENKAVLWRLKTMRQAHAFIGHKDVITSCRFSYARKSVITGSLDRTMKFWDIEKGICSRTVTYFLKINIRK